MACQLCFCLYLLVLFLWLGYFHITINEKMKPLNLKYGCCRFCKQKGQCNQIKCKIQNRKEYWDKCSFKFKVKKYPELLDVELLEKHGWYYTPNINYQRRPPNPNGVSKDHLFSISEGFKLRISPEIISHIANCKIVFQSENSKKDYNCDMTIPELLQKIQVVNQFLFDLKGITL